MPGQPSGRGPPPERPRSRTISAQKRWRVGSRVHGDV